MIIKETIADLSDFGIKADVSIPVPDDCSVASINQYTLKNFQKNTPVFLQILREENLEVGYLNSLDSLVNEQIEKDPLITASWLSDMYVHYYSDVRVLHAILFTISRIENPIVKPSLLIMANSGLSHQDIEIRETSIRCFENWSDNASLKFLKTAKADPVSWLEDYKKQVIADIEKKLS